LKADVLKLYMPGIYNLAEQYTNSVSNSKFFVRTITYKRENYKQLFIVNKVIACLKLKNSRKIIK
jgi:hypothetical protein